MPDQDHRTLAWIDILWLILLAGLAVLPPLFEWHKDIILAVIGLYQIFENKILRGFAPGRRNFASILIKVLLATMIVWHTGEVESSYYLIYFLPVVSAAMLYDGWGTMFWTAVSCAAYGLFVIRALQFYRFTEASAAELAIRYVFFFLVAVVVNRFVSENRRQAARYRELAGTLSDTNHRLLEAQNDARRSERLAALGQLSAGLAHEIRNPLGVIRGSAEMLSERLQSADALTGELAGYISTEVERLNSLVGRFLDFARPLQPKLEVQRIAPIIERALRSVHDQYPKSKVEIEKQFDNDMPPLPIDDELVERVFINLFANAFEAMQDGGTLRITLRAGESNGRGGAVVTVEDTGPGVPAAQREQIFNPFFTTKKTGVGLGLSIVSKIVDDHHGWIRLDGVPEGGACFRLFFPYSG
ncbi:MAG: two-component system sensor histidine kinase NtrB [Terriglobia bacterium]